MIPEFTLVVGVDRSHLQQLALVWPTWRKNRPEILQHPMLVFYDRYQIDRQDVHRVVDHPDLEVVPYGWEIKSQGSGKWDDPQRAMMLNGFVSIPSKLVHTPYWLKLDTDVVAVRHCNWILPHWFESNPAIVAHRWSFTKPANQMALLDAWAVTRDWRKEWKTGPLNLHPRPGADKLGHNRIISWCGFFSYDFTALCASLAGEQLPVPSQDGYMWYCAKRLNLPIERVNMKTMGWEHWHTMANIKDAVKRAMQ